MQKILANHLSTNNISYGMKLNSSSNIQDSNWLEWQFGFDFVKEEDNPSKSNLITISSKYETDLILPEYLVELAKEEKFIAVIGAPKKINREWLKKLGLPLEMFMQINSGSTSIQNMRLLLKTLSSSNFSGALCWLPEVSAEQQAQIIQAADYGNSTAIVMPIHSLH